MSVYARFASRRLNAFSKISPKAPLNVKYHSTRELLNIHVASSHGNTNGDGSETYSYGGLWSLMFMFSAVLAHKAVNNKAECCGIVGVVGSDDANAFLIEGKHCLKSFKSAHQLIKSPIINHKS